MCVLIGNMVKTKTADYPCGTREEAEALYLALRSGSQQARREAQGESTKPLSMNPAAVSASTTSPS